MTDPVPVVLVVDIDPDTHALIEGALPEAECTLVSARSSEIALKMAERRHPTVLVIGDRMAGIAYLTERLRRLTPHLHVVLLTSQDQPQDTTPFTAPTDPAQRPLPRGAASASIMRKPVEPARFRSTVRTALRLAGMAAGVKRMRGTPGSGATTAESGAMPRVTPIPWMSGTGPGRDNNK